MSAHEQQNDVTLLNIRQVMGRIGLSRPSVYSRMATGDFPRPVYPCKRAPRWRSDEIAEWIEALSAERATGEATGEVTK